MISSLIELLALAGLVKTAAFAGPVAAWATGSVGLLFIGYALGETAADMVIARQVRRARAGWRRMMARERAIAGEPVSPHPPIRVDAESQARNDRLVAARQRRINFNGRDLTPALSRNDYNGD